MSAGGRIADFRRRVRSGEPSIGTFIKTPHPVIVEIMGLSGLDCVCIDAEHAPFDRSALDAALLAARANDLPSLVRIPSNDPAYILQALDLGATGVVIPHVRTKSDAQRAADATRFGTRGGRGFAGSTRAAGYATRQMTEIISQANAECVCVLQIEDADAVQAINEIASVDGFDCLFVGRADLTVSMAADSANDPRVIEAVHLVCEAGRRHGKATGMFTPTTAEAEKWLAEGASLFLLRSDQQFVLDGARALTDEFRALRTPKN